MTVRTEREWIVEGLSERGVEPAEETIQRVRKELAHTNIRRVAIDRALSPAPDRTNVFVR